MQAPAPVQSLAPGHSVSGSVPAAMKPHVPSPPPPAPFFAAVHASHLAPQSELQHTPSTQKPLWHCGPVLQLAPRGSVQVPAAAHVVAPAQSLSGSVPGVTSAQVPLALPVFALLHAWHSVVQAPLQQNPSTQKPPWHWPALLHELPTGPQQAPAPLHVVEPAHSVSGSVFMSTGEHAPFAPVLFAALHAWQVPVHATLQQKPSTQNPLWHCEAAVHAVPFGASQAPAPLHCVVHSLSGSVFTVTGAQVPLPAPVRLLLHAWHSPPQADAQQ